MCLVGRQVSHKAYAAGLFTSAWPRSTYRKADIRAAALRALLKVLLNYQSWIFRTGDMRRRRLSPFLGSALLAPVALPGSPRQLPSCMPQATYRQWQESQHCICDRHNLMAFKV